MQVKYRSIGKNGAVSVKLEQNTFTNRTTYTEQNIDYIALYVLELDAVYMIPINEISSKTEVSFRCKETKITNQLMCV